MPPPSTRTSTRPQVLRRGTDKGPTRLRRDLLVAPNSFILNLQAKRTFSLTSVPIIVVAYCVLPTSLLPAIPPTFLSGALFLRSL